MNLRFPVLPAILVVSVLPLDVAWRRSRQSVIGLGLPILVRETVQVCLTSARPAVILVSENRELGRIGGLSRGRPWGSCM